MEYSDDLAYFKFTLRLLYEDGYYEDMDLFPAFELIPLEDELFIFVLN